MLRRIGLAALCAVAVVPLSSASAIPIRVGGTTGGITVASDLGACGSVTFPGPVTAVGVFTSTGALVGPSTVVGVVRGALPVTLVNATSWYGCLPDAYAGATAGWATYTLTASTETADFVETLQCTVTSGVVTCT